MSVDDRSKHPTLTQVARTAFPAELAAEVIEAVAVVQPAAYPPLASSTVPASVAGNCRQPSCLPRPFRTTATWVYLWVSIPMTF